MGFKNFLLNESPHGTVNPPYETPQGIIYNLDLHVEHWEINTSKAAAEVKNKLMKFVWLPEFYGKLPDGKYLYNDGKGLFNFSVIDSPTQNKNAINLDDLPGLKGSWWDYVSGYDDADNIVKSPSSTSRPELIQQYYTKAKQRPVAIA